MIKLYNSLTRKKQALKAEARKRLNLFVCGPTTYDVSHIGHARTYIVFDALVKYLRAQGGKIFYLQNITNIDDKIINRAKAEGVEALKLSAGYEKEYLEDMASLGIDSIDKYARATDYIPEIINQVKRLIKKGYGYQIEDGIYYDISKFKNYGKLSARTVIQAEDAVSRIDESKGKRNKGDFALWKFSKPGEPFWSSPFGPGRPGWHIEDTAITEKFFGPQYDLHGGGRDLLFPHHEAEVAQMEAISGKRPLARFWLHSGMLNVGGYKMSKSLRNFITIRQFLKNHSPALLRFLVLRVLWRSPLNYDNSFVRDSKAALQRLTDFVSRLAKLNKQKRGQRSFRAKREADKLYQILAAAKKKFWQYLADDFNTPKAFGALFGLIKKLNPLLETGKISRQRGQEIIKFIKEINKIFAIIDFKTVKEQSIPAKIKKMIELREKYRQAKQWQKADLIRQKLSKQGFRVEDTSEGPRLK